jgi:hypothetical protein
VKISATYRIAAVLVAVAGLTFVTGVAQGASSRPAGMSVGAYQSLVIRSRALDHMYGLDRRNWKPAAMPEGAYRSLVIRSQALDDKYGPGRTDVARSSAPSRPQDVSASGFAWSDFGVGAAAMLGLVLIVGGLVVGGHHARRAPNPRVTS